jgi:hypothetical protein
MKVSFVLPAVLVFLVLESRAATVSSVISPLVLNDGDTAEINLNESLGPVLDTTIELEVDANDLGSNSILNFVDGPGSQVATIGAGSTDALRLDVGDSVGPTLNFANAAISFEGASENATFGLVSGEWGGGAVGYVGLQFDIAGSTHYGFVRVSWFPDNDRTTSDSFAVIDQIGYNIVPGEPAVIPEFIPEPSSMLLLVLGGLPLAFSRRR